MAMNWMSARAAWRLWWATVAVVLGVAVVFGLVTGNWTPTLFLIGVAVVLLGALHFWPLPPQR